MPLLRGLAGEEPGVEVAGLVEDFGVLEYLSIGPGDILGVLGSSPLASDILKKKFYFNFYARILFRYLNLVI